VKAVMPLLSLENLSATTSPSKARAWFAPSTT